MRVLASSLTKATFKNKVLKGVWNNGNIQPYS
jgi:hypothetical protein